MKQRVAIVALLTLVVAAATVARSMSVDPAQATPDSWWPAAGLTEARDCQSATLLTTGQVLVAGGFGLNTAELYEPTTDTWTPTASMMDVRTCHTASRLLDGRVLVVGGTPDNVSAVAGAEVYDPTPEAWSQVGSLPSGRWAHTATVLNDGRVLITGGFSHQAPGQSDAYLFDPSDDSWLTLPSMTHARQSHSATLLNDGRVLVVGGHNGTSYVGQSEIFNPTTGTWSLAGSLATPRNSHFAAKLFNGKILIAGGYGCNSGCGTLESSELYDIATDSFSPTGSLGSPRYAHSGATLQSGEVIVSGGWSSILLQPRTSTELYSPQSGMWIPAAAMAVARTDHEITPLLDGRLLVTGGTFQAPIADVEIYAPATLPFTMSIDCNLEVGGIQASCDTNAGPFDAGVLLTNNSGAPIQMIGWEFRLVSNKTVLNPVVPAICPSPSLNCNPDFDEASAVGLWDCSAPPPNPDVNSDGDPATAESYIACVNFNDEYLTSGETRRLAIVHFAASEGSAILFIRDGYVYDGGEVMSCNPVVTNAGQCNYTSVDVGPSLPTGTPTLTFTPTLTLTPTNTHTPTVTPTPCPDSDCDSVPDAMDNCPSVPNADQLNGDRNLIDQSPPFASNVDDRTRANSDADGDACDPDDDNDGLADSVESLPLPCPAASGPTNSTTSDSDGDRFIDSVECAFGADPANPASKPAFAVCGPSTDSDGDKIQDRIEVCYYNTDPGNTDTDGDRTLDGGTDGCEVASVNPDRIVNVADRGLVALAVGSPAMRHVNVDLNKDGAWNVGDIGFVALHFGQCPG